MIHDLWIQQAYYEKVEMNWQASKDRSKFTSLMYVRYSSQTPYRIKIDRIQQALALLAFCKYSIFLHNKHRPGGEF